MPFFGSQDSLESVTPSKQVQFGRSPSETSKQSVELVSEKASTKSSNESININEKLRHHAPTSERSIEVLGVMESKIYTAVLHECLEEISILRRMNRMGRSDIGFTYTSLKEKYENSEYELDAIVNNCEEYFVYKKLKQDLSWFETILLRTINDINKSYYFEELLKILEAENLIREEEQTIIAAKEFNQKEIGKLKSYMDVERREMTVAIQKLTHQLGNFKDLLNDNIAESNVKVNYVKQWEKSRYEQNLEKLKKKEAGYLNRTSTMTRNIEKENIVHDEMSVYIDESMQEYQNEIEKWMEKYDFDLEEKENDVHSLNIKREKQKDEFGELQEEFETRQKQIDDYKAHKLKKAEEERELARQTRAVILIQCWWRGVMFRKHLGPYKKRKKGKGGRKSAKKK